MPYFKVSLNIKKVKILRQKQPTRKRREMENRWNRLLAVLIRECGFAWANPDIVAEKFMLLCRISFNPVEIVSIKPHLKEIGKPWIITDDILAYFDKLSFRPANLPELLCWWLKNKTSWTESTVVVALGSVGLNRFGNLCAPYIYCWHGEPKFGLHKREYVFTEIYSFAVVRKMQQSE